MKPLQPGPLRGERETLASCWGAIIRLCLTAAACLAAGCAVPVAPRAAVAPPTASAPGEPFQFRSSSVCVAAEATGVLGLPAQRSECCPATGQLSPLGSGAVRLGHVANACGPAPIEVHTLREPSSSPAERARPPGQFFEMAW